ncbi:hypothetical protein GO986_08775 [Deinococcus sp. HMF7620]|uniref:Uncharacterized protein n=1 Tax=Deinococcus arboris TaxID=2682977 RepID=A0A7C9LN40_9DEIO|nr:hypothetical protein [Deinococcus arboris]MVN86856.1 hypothetical protein [Deinococcus arboris]
MNINWSNFLITEVGILLVLGLHLVMLSRLGSPRTRRNVDIGMSIAFQIWVPLFGLALCGLLTVVSFVPLLKLLPTTSTVKDLTLVLEIVVSAFSLLSILSVVYPLALQRQLKQANTLTLGTVALLAFGSFAGTVFKALVANEAFSNLWTTISGMAFLTSFYAVVVLFVWGLWLIARSYFARPRLADATDGTSPLPASSDVS